MLFCRQLLAGVHGGAEAGAEAGAEVWGETGRLRGPFTWPLQHRLQHPRAHQPGVGNKTKQNKTKQQITQGSPHPAPPHAPATAHFPFGRYAIPRTPTTSPYDKHPTATGMHARRSTHECPGGGSRGGMGHPHKNSHVTETESAAKLPQKCSYKFHENTPSKLRQKKDRSA